MIKRVLAMTAVTGAVALLMGQQPAQPPSVAVPKGKEISKKEADAIKKIQDAKTPDETIAAVENLITNFADTIFKGTALYEAAEAADQKGDYAKAVSYGELSIEADPKRFDAMLLVAGELAQHTQKFDLDKEEKLTKSEKYIKQAMDMVPAAVKPSAAVPDNTWETYKKDKMAEGYKDLGLVATARSKFDVAANNFKLAVDTEATPDPVLMARLGNAYNQTGKYTEALEVLNKALATPDLDPRVKAFADQEKATAQKNLKGK
jgi:tetratricopeptide (TPR) repeat protein